MRRALKNSIIGSVKKLYEQHDNARKFIEKKTPVNAKKALSECKAAVRRAYEETVKSEGESCPAAVCFNEYLAAVDEAIANIFKETNGNKLRKSLDKLLLKAENSVKDIKIRLEVVFMPYKASMWDSLESIWRAASDDPDCDVYAVPIPYCDRAPDGSFGELHYEGEDYPEYVPVTHYEEYDLAARKPDIIYIHNAYDGANTVTSVDPRYYSSEMKKYTDMLVYVPYFVLEELSPYKGTAEEEAICRGRRHFCLLPGVVNSDRVIVQSESMREYYINVLLESADNSSRGAAERYLGEKIVSLGTPKFDKAINAKREEYPLPEEWQELIRDKQAVMLNTALPALLNSNEKYLEKLKKIISVFEEREDKALWWRPHPLMESTIASMRPQLLDEYRRIANDFRERKVGIFDATPELYRAVAWCGGYYGDRSSVSWLFGAAGKPVLISSVKREKRESLVIEKLWYTYDIEENDLTDWLDGKEKWTYGAAFSEAFGYDYFDGSSGEHIHKFIKEAVYR